MRSSLAVGLSMAAALACAGCKKASKPPEAKRAPAVPATPVLAMSPAVKPDAGAQDPVAEARQEFELVPEAYAAGTSKLYSRGDFLPLDDPRGISEGDFIGRLRTLFGPVDNDDYVLRHRATGLLITAYAAQSGPSYGGGPRFPGALPKPEASGSLDAMRADADARVARIQADPSLAKRPVDWSQFDTQKMTPEEVKPLREKEKLWMKHFEDVAAPPGFAAVVTRLEALVDQVKPSDWQATRYWSDDPGVYVVGAQGGEDFLRELAPRQAMEWLLREAELGRREAADGGSPDDAQELDLRVLDYWSYHEKDRKQMNAALHRVQDAWFRVVDTAHREDKELREADLEQARETQPSLALDARQADAALRAK